MACQDWHAGESIKKSRRKQPSDVPLWMNTMPALNYQKFGSPLHLRCLSETATIERFLPFQITLEAGVVLNLNSIRAAESSFVNIWPLARNHRDNAACLFRCGNSLVKQIVFRSTSLRTSRTNLIESFLFVSCFFLFYVYSSPFLSWLRLRDSQIWRHPRT